MKQPKQYAFADTKKNSLDLLNSEVQAAEYTVSELQAVLTALQQKSSEFSEFLNDAEASKETALTNLNLFKATLNSVTELQRNAQTLNKQTDSANTGIGATAEQVSELIKQLIYSGEMVNDFAQLVFKKKQMNPLISDELVKTVTTATADVNEAVASTLTALQSCYSSKGVAGESASLSQLQLAQANGLLEMMTGKKIAPSPLTPKQPVMFNTGELDTLITAVETAKKSVKEALDGKHAVTDETYTSIDALVKKIFELIENDKGLRKKVTDIETKLCAEKMGKADPKKIKTLETSLKNTKAQYDTNHQELLDSVSELISIYEATGDEKCSVTSAQQYLKNCQDLFGDIAAKKAQREKVAKDLRVKICKATDELERMKLEIMLQYEEAMIALDVILLECKERTLTLANKWLATANAHFIAADADLVKANKALSNAVDPTQASPSTKTNASLQTSLENGYQYALNHYHAVLKANDVATQQLDDAQAKLDNATHQLNSLKAGLSAATAAALAA